MALLHKNANREKYILKWFGKYSVAQIATHCGWTIAQVREIITKHGLDVESTLSPVIRTRRGEEYPRLSKP